MSGRLSETGKGAGDHWRVLLTELVHLLGLYLNHARHAKGVRATAVLFDQLVRRLNILDQMPGHDGGLIVRRLHFSSTGKSEPHNYLLLFGDMALRGSEVLALDEKNQRRISHLGHALDKAFGYFQEQGIYALYLQLPGQSVGRIDQLRLALNIVALYRLALENNASITFRYLGRALTVPLVRDSKGRPDPNLTLVAGLNGLSAANARELIKQAQAYCNLSEVRNSANRPISDFNLIFSVRSLRTQLIRPPVEINNLPWMNTPAPPSDVELHAMTHATANVEPLLDKNATSQGIGQEARSEGSSMDAVSDYPGQPELSQQYIAERIDIRDERVRDALEKIYARDYATLNSEQIADRLLAVSQILTAVEEVNDETFIQGVLNIFNDRLGHVPESVLDNIEVQRQGLKIMSVGRTMMLGMMPPRLLELIAMIKEGVLTRKKIELFKRPSLDFDQIRRDDLRTLFGVAGADHEHLRDQIQACLDRRGKFSRQSFVSQIHHMKPNDHIMFEIFWCFLRQSSQRQERLDILNALPMLLIHLTDRNRALRFLMSDLCQDPMQIAFTDRNAFVLATLLLRMHNKELNIDIDCTPLEVLNVKRSLNASACKYAAWRLDMDQERVMAKIHTIRNQICHTAMTPLEKKKQLTFELGFLLALEREALIFMALTGGKTARKVFCQALALYGEPQSGIYVDPYSRRHLADLMHQLMIVVQGLGRVGHRNDIEYLKALERQSQRLSTLDNEPGHALRVKQVMELIPLSIKALQVSGE